MANRLKIKEIREIKKLTQDDVVRLSGIPKRSYNDYESGKTDIPASRLQDIAKALDVTVGVIFGYSDPKTRKKYEDRVLEDTEEYILPKIDDSEVDFIHREDKQKPENQNELKAHFEKLLKKVNKTIVKLEKEDVIEIDALEELKGFILLKKEIQKELDSF